MTTLTARYSPDMIDTAEAAFHKAYPAYTATAVLDKLRQTEYVRLDANKQIYLDYTGGGLYAISQLDQHFKLLRESVYGNPHSQNPTSLAMTKLVDQARAYVMAYFNASPDEYVAIFTPNASGALKLVGESYPFTAGSHYMLIYDNHNSVNGIREFAEARGAEVNYLRTTLPELRINAEQLNQQLDQADPDKHNLFAYPAQSNFSGVQHSLEWIAKAQQCGWDVLLDAAAFVPTNPLDLSRWKPDFVPMSFYKMFGYPTGVGCLLVRKAALPKLQRPWFAGGTITITSVQGSGWHYLIDNEAGYEDGTVNYLSLPAIEIGLRHVESIGIDVIHDRVVCLTGWLLAEMLTMEHSNGRCLVNVYGPHTLTDRGGTIAFSLDDPDGQRFDYRRIEYLANKAGISLRTGCFCNPGTGEIVHNLSRDEMAQAFTMQDALSFEALYQMACDVFDKHPSALRISTGLATNFADVYAFMRFLSTFVDQSAAEINGIDLQTQAPLRDAA